MRYIQTYIRILPQKQYKSHYFRMPIPNQAKPKKGDMYYDLYEKYTIDEIKCNKQGELIAYCTVEKAKNFFKNIGFVKG